MARYALVIANLLGSASCFAPLRPTLNLRKIHGDRLRSNSWTFFSYSPHHSVSFLHLVAANTLEGKPISGPLVPLSNFVLVKVREAKAQTLGGIVLPDQAKEKPTEGTVVSTGPGKVHLDTNVVITMPCSVGDGVLYGKFDGSKIDYNGMEHTLIRDEDILLFYKGEDMNLENIVPAWDRLLVKVAKSNEATASGIVVAPTSGGEELASEGQVVSVGKGRMASNGELTPMGMSVGEFVKFRDYAGSEIRIDGSEFIIVRASDCLAKWS